MTGLAGNMPALFAAVALSGCQTTGEEPSASSAAAAGSGEIAQAEAVGVEGPCTPASPCLMTGYYLFDGDRFPFEARIDGETGTYRDIGALARGRYEDPIASAETGEDGAVVYAWTIDGYRFGDLARTSASVRATVRPDGSAAFLFYDKPVFDNEEAYVARGVTLATDVEG